MVREDFGELRSLLQQPPSSVGWAQLCQSLDRWPKSTLRQVALPYAQGNVSRMPVALRDAPTRWVDQLMRGRLHDGMALVRKLDLSGRRLGPAAVKPICALLNAMTIEVISLRSMELDAAVMSVLMAQPFWAHVREADFGGNAFGRAGVKAILSSSQLTRVERLGLEDVWLDDEGFKLLASAQNLPSLRHLELGRNHFTYNIKHELGSSALILGLESLGLSGALSQWQTRDLERALSFGDASLKRLDLSRNVLQGPLLSLRRMPWLSQLEALDVSVGDGHRATPRWIALEGLDGASALRELTLDRCEVELGTLLPALASMVGLERLSLRQCARSRGFLRGFLTQVQLGALQALDLSFNASYAMAYGVRHDEEIPGLPALRELSLCGIGLGDSGDDAASVWIGWLDKLPALTALDLSANAIDVELWHALMAAAWMTRLERLVIQENNRYCYDEERRARRAQSAWRLKHLVLGRLSMSPAALQRCLEPMELSSVEQLELSSQEIDRALMRYLARAAGLKRLKRWRLERCEVSEEALEQLSMSKRLGALAQLELRQSSPAGEVWERALKHAGTAGELAVRVVEL